VRDRIAARVGRGEEIAVFIVAEVGGARRGVQDLANAIEGIVGEAGGTAEGIDLFDEARDGSYSRAVVLPSGSVTLTRSPWPL
jgi:hypothetical protein